jgi:hypothetical protein
MSDIEHVVFVYRDLYTGEILCFYAEEARAIYNDNNFEHLATLNPRMWIQCNWDKVGGADPQDHADLTAQDSELHEIHKGGGGALS